MTKKEKRILIISGIINIIGIIWGIVASIYAYINGYAIQNTLQQFILTTLFFQFIVVVLVIFRKKAEHRGVRLIMLLGIIHISAAFTLELIDYIVVFIKNII